MSNVNILSNLWYTEAAWMLTIHIWCFHNVLGECFNQLEVCPLMGGILPVMCWCYNITTTTTTDNRNPKKLNTEERRTVGLYLIQLSSQAFDRDHGLLISSQPFTCWCTSPRCGSNGWINSLAVIVPSVASHMEVLNYICSPSITPLLSRCISKLLALISLSPLIILLRW